LLMLASSLNCSLKWTNVVRQSKV
ncbi:putrescine-ornithine antiporter, partial [Vibrio parahaemolyticus EKP-028]